jgi:SSS family solute:Na+ symporter
VVTSLATQSPNYAAIQGLAFGTLTEEQKLAQKESFSWIDVVFSVLLVMVVLSVLVYFTG